MSKEESVKKPSWDGRQEFVSLLMRRVENAGNQITDQEYRRAYEELSRMYSQVKPWISTSDSATIQSLLRKVERRLRARLNNDSFAIGLEVYNNRFIRKNLGDIERRLVEASKHLMLTTSSDVSDDDLDFTKIRSEFT
jgi:hypothetical protein